MIVEARHRFAFWFVPVALFVLLAHAGLARAQEAGSEVESVEAPAPEAPKPWAVGVAEETKAAALALFETGNAFFERSQYSQALAEYRQAVAVWDHPAIRYNMAVCLINLDEPLQAHESLTKGLAYGDAPLSQKLYAEGTTYMKLLMGRLAEVTISGKQSNAVVTLDGQPLFTGAGTAERLLLPGKHLLISKSEGMMTYTSELMLEPGKNTEVAIKMIPLSESVVMRRRWATWKPWAVAGGGVGLAALGGIAFVLSDANFTAFEAGVARECPQGCDESVLPSSVSKLESRAELQGIASTSLLIAGGAVAATGLVMMFLNRPRAFQLEDAPAAKEPPVALVPVLSPDTVVVAGAFRF